MTRPIRCIIAALATLTLAGCASSTDEPAQIDSFTTSEQCRVWEILQENMGRDLAVLEMLEHYSNDTDATAAAVDVCQSLGYTIG